MSVQSSRSARLGRLGLHVPSPPIVNMALVRPAPVVEPEPAPIELPPAEQWLPAITREHFAWAHRLADDFGGDASELIERSQWRIMFGEVCQAFNVSPTDIRSSRRAANVVWPRQVLMWLMRTYTELSYPEIGKRLAGRDHSTVLHAFNTVNESIDCAGIPITKETNWRDALVLLAKFDKKPVRRCRP